MSPTSTAPSTVARILVVIALVPVCFGLWFLTLFMTPAGSPWMLLSLVPPAVVIWAVVRSLRRTPETTGATHAGGESKVAVMPLVIAPVLAIGTWFALLLVGMLMGVVPFMTPPDTPHPLEGEWNAGSVLIAMVSLPLWWLLLAKGVGRSGRHGVARTTGGRA